MGYFANELDTLSLPSDPSQTVTVKRRVIGSDHAVAIRSVAGLEGTERYQAYMFALVPLMVVEWTLTDDKGQLAPITSETFGDMPKEDFEFLWGEVDSRTSLRPEEKEAPFENGSGRRSRATPSKPRRS